MIDARKFAEARYTADTIQEMYCGGSWGRLATFSEEKERIKHYESLYKAEGTVQMPNKIDQVKTEPYNTENLIYSASKDAMRLVGETTPSIRCRAIGGNEESKDEALLRQAIALGYRIGDDLANSAEEMVLHLIGGAAIYLLCTTRPHGPDCGEEPYSDCEDESHSDYPVHELWHPRGVYPTWQGSRLVDIMYCQRMRLRDAAWAWPEAGIRFDRAKDEWGEILTYLDKDEYYRCLWPEGGNPKGPSRRGEPITLDYKRLKIGRVPVAWVKEPSFHGGFEGIFDQAEGMQTFLNQAATLAMIAARQNVFPETIERGVQRHLSGPRGKYELDPNPSIAAGVNVLPPKELPASLLNMMGIANEGLRGALVYPAQPGGQDLPSIISAAGVQAVSGRQNRMVWHMQRLIAQVWAAQSDIDRRIDTAYLNYNKPMLSPSGDRYTYTPSEVWKRGTRYRIEVVYPGGGMSPLNRMVANLQKFAAGLMSDEEFLEQDPDVVDPGESIRRVLDYRNRQLVYGLATQQATLESAIAFATEVQDGKKVLEAAKMLIQKPEPGSQPALPAAGGAYGSDGSALPLPSQPGAAAGQAEGLMKGAIPGGGSPSLRPSLPARSVGELLVTPPGR